MVESGTTLSAAMNMFTVHPLVVSVWIKRAVVSKSMSARTLPRSIHAPALAKVIRVWVDGKEIPHIPLLNRVNRPAVGVMLKVENAGIRLRYKHFIENR